MEHQQQPSTNDEYLRGVDEELGASPDRYCWKEGQKRSQYSEDAMQRYHELSRGSARRIYNIDQNIGPQEGALQKSAWMHRRYSLAIQRASDRDRRLRRRRGGRGGGRWGMGRQEMEYPGAEVMRNRGMMGVRHHAQNLYGLDALRRREFDRKTHYDALEATERRFPLSDGDVQQMRRQEAERMVNAYDEARQEMFQQRPRRRAGRFGGFSVGESGDARRYASAREAGGEYGRQTMPEAISMFMMAIEQLKQEIAGMKREARGEAVSLGEDVKKGITTYVAKVKEYGDVNPYSAHSLELLKGLYRNADESGRIAIALGIVKEFKKNRIESKVTISGEDFQVTDLKPFGTDTLE
ncbi:MAG: hypothetical protein PHE68_03585 [Candidatus Peribacteraceae bacterium]|nr:hypothetical protein [Candidatus Peribacteraceae bacterium]MDD5074697.1 hypothetical protein [Candidatus Peribacteraceae bacterium]